MGNEENFLIEWSEIMAKKTRSATIDELIKGSNGLLTTGGDEALQYSRIPFRIPALDRLTGGGIPKKRISMIVGLPNVGKSFLASQIVGQVQQDGGKAVWVDLEMSWDPKWMQKCGIDLDNILVSQPTTAESAFDLIAALMTNGVDVIVVDSLASLVPAAVSEGDFSYNPIAWQARFINASIPKLLPLLKHGSSLVAINQFRSGIGPVANQTLPGGVAQEYFAHFILQCKRAGWIEDSDKQKIGFDIDVRVRKSKVGGMNYQSTVVPFKLDLGRIDIVELYIREALAQETILKTGAWYTYEDNKIMGQNGLREYFVDNPQQFEKIKVAVDNAP